MHGFDSDVQLLGEVQQDYMTICVLFHMMTHELCAAAELGQVLEGRGCGLVLLHHDMTASAQERPRLASAGLQAHAIHGSGA